MAFDHEQTIIDNKAHGQDQTTTTTTTITTNQNCHLQVSGMGEVPPAGGQAAFTASQWLPQSEHCSSPLQMSSVMQSPACRR